MANDIREIMAGIRSDIQNLTKSFDDYKSSNELLVRDLTARVVNLEVNSGKQLERVSNLAIFQSVFSIIVGAIATYLGVSKQ